MSEFLLLTAVIAELLLLRHLDKTLDELARENIRLRELAKGRL